MPSKKIIAKKLIASDEFANMRFQSGISSLRSQLVTLKNGRGQHRKYSRYAFTEQGVAMLSSVLRSDSAIQVNIEIMRAFLRLRQMLSTNAEEEAPHRFCALGEKMKRPLTAS